MATLGAHLKFLHQRDLPLAFGGVMRVVGTVTDQAVDLDFPRELPPLFPIARLRSSDSALNRHPAGCRPKFRAKFQSEIPASAGRNVPVQFRYENRQHSPG